MRHTFCDCRLLIYTYIIHFNEEFFYSTYLGPKQPRVPLENGTRYFSRFLLTVLPLVSASVDGGDDGIQRSGLNVSGLGKMAGSRRMKWFDMLTGVYICFRFQKHFSWIQWEIHSSLRSIELNAIYGNENLIKGLTPGGISHPWNCNTSFGAMRGRRDVTTAEIRRPSLMTAVYQRVNNFMESLEKRWNISPKKRKGIQWIIVRIDNLPNISIVPDYPKEHLPKDSA